MTPAPRPIAQIIRVNVIEGLKLSRIGFILLFINTEYQSFELRLA